MLLSSVLQTILFLLITIHIALLGREILIDGSSSVVSSNQRYSTSQSYVSYYFDLNNIDADYRASTESYFGICLEPRSLQAYSLAVQAGGECSLILETNFISLITRLD